MATTTTLLLGVGGGGGGSKRMRFIAVSMLLLLPWLVSSYQAVARLGCTAIAATARQPLQQIKRSVTVAPQQRPDNSYDLATRLYSISVSGTIYADEKRNEDDVVVIVKLFTKQGCTLCDRVRDVLHQIKKEHPHTLIAVDITDTKEWWEKYKYDIPVLHLNNQYWTKHRLTAEQAVEGLVQAAAGTFASPPGEPDASAQETKRTKQKSSGQ